MNKILLHTCCAPCLLFPLDILRKRDCHITGYFYNPNIHPYKEFRRRLTCLELVTSKEALPVIIDRDYMMKDFLRIVVHDEDNRCHHCYSMRLEKTALFAKDNGYDSFTSTLLYSRYQNHTKIRAICEELASIHNISFYYQDFRVGWQEGIDRSKEQNLYRQPYCGCIYSEQERYDNRLKKRLRKNRKTKTKQSC